MPIVEIEGVIQNYAWGSKTAIAEFQGRAPSGQTEAELWFGTHARGPSRLVVGSHGSVDLRDFVGEELPFLFKILAAERPLSLQAHPSREQAEAGFEKEERAGVPVDAPTRNYRDRNHKPELICARTEFHALSGFRPLDESLALVDAVGLRPLLPLFVDQLAAGDLKSAFCGLFELGMEDLRGSIFVVRKWATVAATLPNAAADVAPWLVSLAESHPEDPGVLAALLLNYVHLKPGEAMYLPAGNLHAYLHGVGLELMASSDNVMRGGLTPKHVDVKELCRVLQFSPLQPEVLSEKFEERGEGVRECVYRTAATEFELRRVEVSRVETGGEPSSGEQPSDPAGYEVEGPAFVLVELGEVELTSGPSRLVLGAGRAAFVSAASVVGLEGEGKAAIAALPRP